MLYYEYLCNHDRKRVIYLNHYEDKENMNKQSGDDVPQHSRRRKKEEAKHRRPSRKEQFEMRRQEASSESVSGSAAASSSGKEKKEKKKKKYRMNWKRFILVCFCLCMLAGVAVVGWAASVIMKAPEIDTSNIYSLLSQSSVLYDDQGQVLDTLV